jgi:hypothetical protein
MVSLFMAGCGSSDSAVGDTSVDSTSEELRPTEVEGECIRVGVTRHFDLQLDLTAQDWFHGYMRARTPLRTRTELFMQQAKGPGGGSVERHAPESGREAVDIRWNRSDGERCARVYAKDPCSGAWVGTPWSCFFK